MTDQEKIDLLIEEFEYYVSQRACGCGHPSCSRCEDDRDAREALHKAL